MTTVDRLLTQHAPWACADREWPLTPFELFLWFDDRPEFPLLFQVDIRFEGAIDPETMREAYRFALGRHPLLRATIRRQGRGATWHAPAEGWHSLEVYPRGVDGEPGMEWVDLTCASGLRGWLRETSLGWDMKLLFHHACCDGQGARMFIQDLVLAYAVLRDACEHSKPFPTIDVAHLDRRGVHVPGKEGGMPHLRRIRNTLRLVFLGPRPAAVESPRPPPAAESHGTIGFCSHTFSPDVVARLQDPRRLDGSSFNDVAVAVLFSVLGDWQRRHGTSPSAWIRITVPTDLRTRDDERMPAANRYTYLFLNRRLRDCGDWASLLPGVRGELQAMRRSGEGLGLLTTLGIASKWPRALAWVLRRRICFATALVTNLSDPSRRLRKRLHVDDDGFFWLAGARCVALDVRTPPLRPRTHWGFGIFEYAGRMTLTFRYDASTISPGAAERVMADYVESLMAWLAAN